MKTSKSFPIISSKLRKWSISDRLKFAFGLLVLIQVISGMVTWFQISLINQDISQLVNVDEPLEEAILEMEIKAGEIARAVLDYVRDRDQKHLSKLINSRDGFTDNYLRYQRLAKSNDELLLRNKISSLYEKYNQMASQIIDLSDRRDVALNVFINHVSIINQLIDRERLKSNDDQSDEGIKKAEATHKMEKYLNIAFGSIEEYIVKRNQTLLSRIFDAEQKFKLFEAQYLDIISNRIELKRIKIIDEKFSQATAYGNQVVKITDEIDDLLSTFEQNLDSIDALLQNQAHTLVHLKTVKTTHHADSSIQSAKLVIGILACLGTFFGLLLVWMISRGIVSPILQLSQSAELIASGNVDHRISIDSQDEIGKLAEAFNRMVEDLVIAQQDAEKASQIKSSFLANMSHEIRTPMTAILGFAEIMRQHNDDPEMNRHIDTIKKNGEYLLELINDILDVSKIEADKLEVEAIHCSLIELLDDVKTLMEIRAIDRGLDLTVLIDGSIPRWIQSDPVRIRQILINLLSNAIKFTRQGQVQLIVAASSIDTDEPVIQFDVIDSGIGMTGEQISRLFKPFMQADSSTTRQYGGTGLGLTICKRLTHILGGEISVKSEYGNGTTFSVTVKTGRCQEKELVDQRTFETECKSTLNQTTESNFAEMNYNILLAEDGIDNQKLISYLLKKSGNTVTIAENGLIAIKKALDALEASSPYDAILMDMQMPELDGFAATKQLRSQGYLYPVIALTAHTMSGAREECLAAGCDSYATKPIQRDQFFATLNQCILDYRKHEATIF
ncbi:Autoinducer 2 sensor kinase/phosphatase LuxQ [Gimesia algae]|uniref:histidine kinase n=2 Tax=Gimesia algae TaxID=2527971 RepID=A0A517VMY2_9PLAN|nr:Autoinducer 2 sensor kinase/phosphatase LuxQ [Gimesia algae]